VEPSTSHNPIGHHGLLQGELFFPEHIALALYPKIFVQKRTAAQYVPAVYRMGLQHVPALQMEKDPFMFKHVAE
jgi:hypothetical protein